MRLRVLAAAVGMVVAVGCDGRPGGVLDRRSTVTIAYPHAENGMNPVDDAVAKFLVFLPLAVENKRGELEGRLARSWEHSSDWREWTFHLRTDVRWHDGAPVTARDVEFTLALLAHPDVGEFGPGYVEAVAVLNDSTLKVRYRNAYPRGAISSTVIFPRHLLLGLDPKDIASWEFWTHPVGDGPYRFVRYEPRTMMEFEANRDYYRGKPRIERVVLRFLGNAGLAELLGGAVDALYATNPTYLRLLAKDPRFRVSHAYDNDAYAIFWKNDDTLFRDSRVRRALTLAIDRRELRQVLDFPPDLPVLDGPYTLRQLRRGDLPTPLPHDTARARALLEEAGWLDTDGDGVRERDGRLFRFTAIVSSRPGWSELAVYVQEQLRRVGVRMEIQPLEQGLVGGRLTEGDFEAAFNFIGWSPNTWSRWFGDSSSIGYRNPRVAQLLRGLPLAVDPDEEDRIRRELAEIFQTDVPATFFFPRLTTVVTHRRIHGLSSPWRADPLIYMDELWVDGER